MSHPAYPDSHLKRMRAGKPIVFDCIEAAAPAALELDVWYEQTHLPRVRGRGLRRYAAPAHAAYFYIQELEGDGPVTAPAPIGQAGVHHHIHCRGLSLGGAHRLDSGLQALEAPYAYPIFFSVPEPWQTHFNQWYDREHIPMLLQCPQWVMCRRFKLEDPCGCTWTHLALHYLSDLSALQSPERTAARSTAWRRELESQPWFRFSHRLGSRLA